MDGKASPLLDDGALQWCFLALVSTACSLVGGRQVCKSLLQLVGEAIECVHTAAARTARASGRARARLYMMSGIADTRLGICAGGFRGRESS